MKKAKIHFKIFSEGIDSSYIDLAINQLHFENIDLKTSYPKNLELKETDVVIIGAHELANKYLDFAIDRVKSVDNKFIIVTDSDDIIFATTLARIGFNDIFVMPFELQKLRSYLENIVENYAFKYSQDAESPDYGEYDFDRIIGTSPKFMNTIKLAKKVADNPDVGVLVLGETGVGKGLLANAIHRNGPKGISPFVDILCTAIPVSLLESELFGYEKGAFTDARTRKIGLFEMAEDGTIFLDEIGDLSQEIQIKLLRAIDNKVIRRLGGNNDIPVNARIISATNRDLKKLVDQKIFRIDLYHRLNVVSIEIPPLRERGEDVLLISDYYINEYSDKFNKNIEGIDNKLKEFILNYDWPGNIRELKNAFERAILLADHEILKYDDFFSSAAVASLEVSAPKTRNVQLNVDFDDVDLTLLDKIYAEKVLARMSGNKSKTAKVLGISRPKLDKLLK